MRYALLRAPSANRVYADAASRLIRAELAAFRDTVLAAALSDIDELSLGGIGYVTFTVPDPGLSPRDVAYLSNLSSLYALFEVAGPDLLRPVPLRPLACHDDDLITIPKYAGKTNEQFTKLLLNVTVLASASAPVMLDRQLTVLDPLCGRGTTLNQALMYGYHAIGIELDAKDVDSYSAFLRTWLRRKRVKHETDTHPVRQNRRLLAHCFDARIVRDTGAPQRVVVYRGDTVQARGFLRAGCADVLVADTPYGVAHGSRTPGQGLSRRPLELLRAAAPVWAQLLRSGGAAGISWNTHVAERADAAQVLADAGLVPVDSPAYQQFGHWVDQAITRDILVARKP